MRPKPQLVTHVLLHPYGGTAGYKQVLASKDPAQVSSVIEGYQASGWTGKVYAVEARDFGEAVEKLDAELYQEQGE